jgi:RimJ/RimL family protein N-acetyltransferase
MPNLFGERIRLRAVEKEDLPTFVPWLNDPEVTENLTVFAPMSLYEEERWYEKMIAGPLAEHVLVIEVKNPETLTGYQPIGTCSFISVEQRSHSAEIGIMIGEKSHWDQGYGTETMRLMVDYGFGVLNLHRIWLRVYAKNKRGIRTYEKAGFQYEGKYRDGEYQHGRYYDVHLMSILHDEWVENFPINPNQSFEVKEN